MINKTSNYVLSSSSPQQTQWRFLVLEPLWCVCWSISLCNQRDWIGFLQTRNKISTSLFLFTDLSCDYRLMRCSLTVAIALYRHASYWTAFVQQQHSSHSIMIDERQLFSWLQQKHNMYANGVQYGMCIMCWVRWGEVVSRGLIDDVATLVGVTVEYSRSRDSGVGMVVFNLFKPGPIFFQ